MTLFKKHKHIRAQNSSKIQSKILYQRAQSIRNVCVHFVLFMYTENESDKVLL